MDTTLQVRLGRYQLIFLIVGLVGLFATVCGAFVNRSQFFFSYLFGCLFCLGLSLGCFLVTMVHLLTGGRWGYPTRRFLEAGFMWVRRGYDVIGTLHINFMFAPTELGIQPPWQVLAFGLAFAFGAMARAALRVRTASLAARQTGSPA